MADKFPFMPLYVNDYLSDTTHLTCEEHGAYLLLLMSMWKRGGQLPCDDVALTRIARLPPQRWKKMRSNIIAFFEVQGAALVHKRLASEFNRSEAISKVRSEIGRRGAEAKRLKSHDPPLAIANGLLKQEASKQQPFHNSQLTKEEAKSKLQNSEHESRAALCVDLGKQITDLMGVTNDPRWMGNWSSVSVWLAKGYDPQLDIIPTVTATIDRIKRTKRAMPGSLNYFEKAISDNYRRRCETGESICKPSVEVITVKRGTPEFKAWIAHFKSVGKRTAFTEKQDFLSVPTLMPPPQQEQTS